MVEKKASDLFLSEGKPPAIRVDGQMLFFEDDKLNIPTDLALFEEFSEKFLSARQREKLEDEGELDLGYSPAARLDQRFRLNLHRQSGRRAMVARALPQGKLDLDSLNLPHLLRELALRPRGLLLITGATGSGKSTTVAALINVINQERACHIVTLEDPIEFVHADNKSRITQREVGPDTRSFHSALRHVVRESPDVIVIGEMRDRETVEVALQAANTGHLVLSTLHTSDAPQSLQRLLGLFPEGHRQQIMMDLSQSLVGILSQRLLPRAGKPGRRVAVELLQSSPAVAKLLAEGRLDELADFLRSTRDPGVIPLNRSLVDLLRQGEIDFETGMRYANPPEEFRLAVQGLKIGVDGFEEVNPTESSSKRDMQTLLEHSSEKGASDLHLSVGRPPMLRINGHLEKIGDEPLTQTEVRWLLFSILSPRQRSQFELEKELDFSLRLENGQRFRVNGYFQRGHFAVALRAIPSIIPKPEDLHLPEGLLRLLDRPQGLILVVGPTGSGKTTTVACLVDQINRSRPCHILTIEDPIEFSHESVLATVDQREVFADTKSFATALKYVLRQDPDVIVVGEMRDLETISAVLTAAETGHLVFATLHTNDAATTIDRIVDVFPSHQQAQIRLQLAASLLGVVSQRLLPLQGGEGRAAAFELLIANTAARALIREGKTHQINNVISTSLEKGMISLDRSIVALVNSGKVEASEAARFMSNTDLLRKQAG
ncbi:unnamed protein product, partial [Phaeothamnion confervicola]